MSEVAKNIVESIGTINPKYMTCRAITLPESNNNKKDTNQNEQQFFLKYKNG